MEHWKDIEGYEGRYQVSDLGRVKSLYKGKERVMSAGKHKMGYLLVTLFNGCKRKTYTIHRLVADAFIPNPNNLPQINHKDECKTNNAVSNLEWCDAKYNNNYGTHKERHTKALSKPVYQYTMEGSLVRSYPSTREAERHTGYSNQLISSCCRGKYKQAYGYIWSYALLNVKGKFF
jgi:hypothetical protein